MFAYKLVCMKAYPRLIRYVGLEIMNDQHIWLSVSSDGLPLINGERSSLSYEEHDGIEKVIWYWLLWILLVTSQVIFVVLSFIWYMVAIAFAAIWLLVGLFLYQTKMLAIGKVWNIWFVAWTRCNDFSKDANLDASLLNESLFHEFIMETIPQIAIQSINNSLIYNGHFPAISLFSLAMSVFIAINGIYRYGYYLIWKGLKFDKIPLPLAVRMQKINNMSILPRKSMITRKFASFVNSVKISDSSMALKATPGNLKRMSQVMLASNATPHEVVASIMFNMEIGIAKLQSMSTVDSKDFAECNHKFDELVFALRNIMRQSKNIALGNNDSASNSTDECDKIVNKVVAIDIDNTMIRHTYGSYSTRVVPVIETVFEPEFNNPNKFIRNFNDNNNQPNFALEEVRPAVLAVDETCNNVTNVCVDVINTYVFNDLDELSDSIAEENVDDFYDLSDDDIA